MSDCQGVEWRADSQEEAGAPRQQHMDLGAVQHDHAETSAATAPLFAPEELEAYGSGRFDLIPLRGPSKLPQSGWRTQAALTIDQARRRTESGSNVGVRLGEGDLVIDVDPKNFVDGVDSWELLKRELGHDFGSYPTVVTGSGGLHVYMRKPADLHVRGTLKGYPGIDFKKHGGFIVAAGSAHPKTGSPYLWDPLSVPLREIADAPDFLLDLIKVGPVTVPVGAGKRSPEELAAMLAGLEVEHFRDHDEWLRVMMACHHATAGEGREEFIAWSVSDPVHADQEWSIGYRWDTLKSDGPGLVTERTLFKLLHAAGQSDLILQDNPADDFADDLEPSGTTEAKFEDQWAWVAGAKEFYRRADGKGFPPDMWRTLHANHWKEGDILNAVWRGRLPIRKFESLVYVPGLPEFPECGRHRGAYNKWRSTAIEPQEGDVSPFLEHMEYLFPDEQERSFVLDYLAILVSRPGEKFNFTLLVRSEQGTGKSWIGQLLEEMLGARNVNRPSNDEILDKWTYWLDSAQLVIVEELMTLGRTEVTNRLKSVITDATLRMQKKGGDYYTIPNHTNLICFTNHADAVRLEGGDRRWLAVFSPAKPREQAYFDRLFGFLRNGGAAAVSWWLRQRRPSLNPLGRAPMTQGKLEMLRLSIDDVEQHIREMVEDRSPPFDNDLFRLDDLVDCLPGRLLGRRANLRNKAISALHEMGAVQHGRYTKGDRARPAWSLWSIRDHERWADAGAAGRIDAFLGHTS